MREIVTTLQGPFYCSTSLIHLVFFSFSCLPPLLCHDYSLPNTCKPNLGYLLFVRVYLHLKSNWHLCASFKMSCVFRLVWARRRRRRRRCKSETGWGKTFTLQWKSGGKPLLPKQSHTSCKNIDGKVMATIQTYFCIFYFRSLSLSVWSYSCSR